MHTLDIREGPWFLCSSLEDMCEREKRARKKDNDVIMHTKFQSSHLILHSFRWYNLCIYIYVWLLRYGERTNEVDEHVLI
jgi:hypothetical protein